MISQINWIHSLMVSNEKGICSVFTSQKARLANHRLYKTNRNNRNFLDIDLISRLEYDQNWLL